MRGITGCALLLLVGCAAEDEQNASPQTITEPEATEVEVRGVERVQIAGQIYGFHADTEEGWGWAKTWTSSGPEEPSGWSIEARGRGEGVIMTQVWVQGIKLSALEVGDLLDLSPFGDNPPGVYIDVIGCAGNIDDEWDVDLDPREGSLQLLERDDESLTFLLDVQLDSSTDAWINTVMTVSIRAADPDSEDS